MSTYQELVEALSEGYTSAKDLVRKKDSKAEVSDMKPRSKGEENFTKGHSVKPKTEKEFETVDKASNATNHVGDHKTHDSDMPKAPMDKSHMNFKKFIKMGGWGKSSYRDADKTAGDKTMPTIKDGKTKVVTPKEKAQTDHIQSPGLKEGTEESAIFAETSDEDLVKMHHYYDRPGLSSDDKLLFNAIKEEIARRDEEELDEGIKDTKDKDGFDYLMTMMNKFEGDSSKKKEYNLLKKKLERIK